MEGLSIFANGECHCMHMRRPLYQFFAFGLFFSFDTTLKKWKVLKRMDVAQYNQSTVAFKDHIIVAGGSTYYCLESISVQRYDPVDDEWTKLASMNYPRYDFGLVEYMGFLFAIGGNTNHADIEVYNYKTNQWVSCTEREIDWRFFLYFCFQYFFQYSSELSVHHRSGT